jgi:hypothetical protein
MHFKLSTRLIITSLLLSIIPLLLVSFYALQIASNEIEEGEREKLTIAREARVDSLKYYFEMIQEQLLSLAQDERIINAMQDFNAAMSSLETEVGKRYDADLAANEGLLKARYAYQESNTPNAPKDAMIRWWPKDRLARMLQHYYIAANPYPNDEKMKMDFSTDGSRYSQVHKNIHLVLRNFMEQFEYRNIFLIDGSSGRMVYSVDKLVDFATSLTTGPYSDSHLAKVFKMATESNATNTIQFVDVAPYVPFYNRHISFVAAPIFKDGTKIGVLIFQLSRVYLEELMTNRHNWEGSGMGKTGESLLIGKDYLLRNESRHVIEEPNSFLQYFKEAGIPEATLQAIEQDKTAVNYLEFKSPAVDAALEGKTGIMHDKHYDGNLIIATYAPLSFAGTNWALVTTIDKDEAFAGLNHLRTAILIATAVIIITVSILSWLFANTISNPIAATVNTISTSSTQMAATTAEQERIANQQAASVNETNTTMEELGVSSKQSSQQAQSASESAQTVLALAEEGGQQVQEMLHAMENLRDKVGAIAQQILRLSEQTSQIGTITGAMTDFANETKMLAMNAAVEAVRAGEHGRGFSVLSVEIRKLAEESKRSAERINSLVADVQKATNATVMATEEGTKTVEKTIDLAHTTATSFSSVAESMHGVSTNAQQISLNVKQQAEAIRQVIVAMNELKTGAREGAAGISQTKDGIKSLNEAALKLKAMA